MEVVEKEGKLQVLSQITEHVVPVKIFPPTTTPFILDTSSFVKMFNLSSSVGYSSEKT